MKCKSAKNLPPNCSGTRQGSLGPCEGGAGLGGGGAGGENKASVSQVTPLGGARER